MDDVIVLAPTRWKLRRAVKVVNEVLTGLRLEKASKKTFIGRVERGFDFLSFLLSPEGIMVAEAPPGNGSVNVRSGFTSKTGGSLVAPPDWMPTSGDGTLGRSGRVGL